MLMSVNENVVLEAWDFEWLWEGFLAGALWSVGGQSERSSRESSRQHLHLHVAFQGLHLLNLCFDPL